MRERGGKYIFMKKIAAFVCLIIAGSFFLSAQSPVNPLDAFYENVHIWENIGLINDAPPLRPYPMQEIKRILNIVIANGDTQQQKTAQQYYNAIFGRVFHFGGSVDGAIEFFPLKKEISIAPMLSINYAIHELFTISADLNLFITNKLPNNELHPITQYSNKDIMPDNAQLGSFTVLPTFNSGVAIGTAEYYFTAGIARTSYGAFYDTGIFIGSHAPHQGQFVFVINKPMWTYTQALLMITATNDLGANRGPNKFLGFHSLEIRPLPWISVGIVDSMIFGGRFEPIYLLPFSAFFMSQGLYAFPDNSLIGLTFGIKPLRGLRIDAALNADDLDFNNMIRFKNHAKWKIAGQFSLSYTMPNTHWFTMIDLNYTFVTPYTFTHLQDKNQSAPNYQNYTHNGIPLASNLEPNSDRINLKLKFKPIEGLGIDLHNTFIRHANITESITRPDVLKAYLTDEYKTDGSTLNHPVVWLADNTAHWNFNETTPFLKQQTIQYINQLGIDVSLRWPILKSGGYMLFKLGYVFEANINPGVTRDIYTPPGTAPATNAAYQAEAERQLSDWRQKARGKEFNHYLRITAAIMY